MLPDGRIADDEVLFRRIPPGSDWFEPPDRFSSGNFKIGRDETGLSVYRASIATPDEVLSLPDAIPGSVIAWARARDIRSAVNGAGQPLNLDVFSADPDGSNPGHAEIRGKLNMSAAKALRDTFRMLLGSRSSE